jgi:hypothetical protein
LTLKLSTSRHNASASTGDQFNVVVAESVDITWTEHPYLDGDILYDDFRFLKALQGKIN